VYHGLPVLVVARMAVAPRINKFLSKCPQVKDSFLRATCDRAERFMDHRLPGVFEDILDETGGLLKMVWSNIYSIDYNLLSDLARASGEKNVLDVEVLPMTSTASDRYSPISLVVTFATDAVIADMAPDMPFGPRTFPNLIDRRSLIGIGLNDDDVANVSRILDSVYTGNTTGAREACPVGDVAYSKEANIILITNPPICTLTSLRHLMTTFAGVIDNITFERHKEDNTVRVIMGIHLGSMATSDSRNGYILHRPLDRTVAARKTAASPY